MQRARTIRVLAAGSPVVLTACAFAACAGPTSTLANAGVTGSEETALGNFVLIVASAVVVIVVAFVLAAAFHRRMAHGVDAGIEPARPQTDRRSILIFGIVLPTIVLAVAFVLTLRTLNAVAAPGRPYAADVTVTGHQWWWEIQYHDDEPSHTFTAANEIHLPVGQPVRFDVQTADVIHTLWVPELAGKIQLIPGQHNSLWLEARVPGVFSGPCSQYCGTQHAHMRITVVAEPASAYEQWLESQRLAAATPSDSARAMGQQVFRQSRMRVVPRDSRNGCWRVDGPRPDAFGIAPNARSGRDRQHAGQPHRRGSRTRKASSRAWICRAMSLRPAELQSLVAYLESLH